MDYKVVPTTTITAFHKFNELPYDVRYLIWKEALFSPGRTVAIHEDNPSPPRIKKTIKKIQRPAMARTCRESRRVAKAYGQYWDDRAWIYPGSHTLVMHTGGELPPPLP